MALTRRKLFKTLAATAAAMGIKEVGVAIAEVSARDTIVLRLPADKHLTSQEMTNLRDAAQRIFPTNKVIVLSDGIDMQIIRGA